MFINLDDAKAKPQPQSATNLTTVKFYLSNINVNAIQNPSDYHLRHKDPQRGFHKVCSGDRNSWVELDPNSHLVPLVQVHCGHQLASCFGRFARTKAIGGLVAKEKVHAFVDSVPCKHFIKVWSSC